MPYTDNPVADYDRYDAEQCRRLATLPMCCCCCEPIQDEHYWDFNGFLYCNDCAESEFRRRTEDYVE